MGITSLCNTPVKVSVNTSVKTYKGLAYVYGYNLADFETYKKCLCEDLGLIDVEIAHWIKPKIKESTAILMSFRENLPVYVSIPGEMTKTKINEYRSRPMMCRKCQQFHHTEKYCNGETVCKRCGDLGHQIEECSATEPRCPHCSLDHIAGSRKCAEYKFQEEVLAIQARDRVPRAQAQLIVERENPGLRLNYADAIKRSATNKTYNVKAPDKRKRSKMDESAELPTNAKRPEIDILLQSPSGRFYTSIISDPKIGTPEHVTQTDDTSENSSVIREEARAIFDELNCENNDLDLYQSELRNASKQHRK